MRRRLSAVLDDVAAELGDLADGAERLQAQLAECSLAGSGGAAAPGGGAALGIDGGEDLMVALQSLDYMTQALQCLARFVSGTARHVPVHCAPDLEAVLGAVSLSALRTRLAHAAPAPEPVMDIELFDIA